MRRVIITPTCVAPRHVDASRDFFVFVFFAERAARGGGVGGGGGAARLFLFFFPCSSDHERDWPPCKVVFFGLATNALNVRNNSNNFQVNNGVLYNLDNIEDIYIRALSVLVSTLDPKIVFTTSNKLYTTIRTSLFPFQSLNQNHM